jgi:NhaA family Na+:H+ antiporter
LGVICGLFFGKQIGVFSFSYFAVKYKLAKLPRFVSWPQMYGVAALTGIGFTMSLFINSLAFKETTLFYHTDKLGILIGSLLSGILGYTILRLVKGKRNFGSKRD